MLWGWRRHSSHAWCWRVLLIGGDGAKHGEDGQPVVGRPVPGREQGGTEQDGQAAGCECERGGDGQRPALGCRCGHGFQSLLKKGWDQEPRARVMTASGARSFHVASVCMLSGRAHDLMIWRHGSPMGLISAGITPADLAGDG